MSNYYCLNCGSLVPEGKKFCPVCGEPVIAHRTLPTENVKFPSEADTIDFAPQQETAQLSKPQDDAKTISVEKPKSVKQSSAAAEKKPSFLSRIFFEEVEISDEEEAELEAKKNNKKKGNHSHVLPVILIIILGILIGAFAYLYIEKPALLNRGLHKIGLGLPGYSETASSTASASAASTATPTITAAPAASAASSKNLGSLTVTLESINIRDTAATTGNAVGKAMQGSKYTVLATQTGEGYTWYEIGQDQWIADSNGEWVSYQAN